MALLYCECAVYEKCAILWELQMKPHSLSTVLRAET